ncbi:putative glucose-methanol-choline oxidoreductase, FAD/NAD(P)-binding domain-containing protein [Heracleum sosnowskyi]|uniref:Glucose-methanol-choline oxidoreductase, FAD/NAD(P)-binding domain-containing protein n=1 Tax=Heracleum sosnowskyi TaxID=360622 RepID=A0AAD8M5H7_9APIA|nr:putative glucose-methanol-choline oxidoreductase, FAD/NAD(P)-binding domain-containing protein [Heracleum sosnowskyi]
MKMIIKFFLLLSFFTFCRGKKIHTWEEEYPFIKNASSFSSVAKNREYDYIIVGGGTAGCPLAATLSQNFNVLLLERGGVPYGNKNTSLKNFHINLADTSPNSPAQLFVVEGVFNVRPRILGGGSSINGGFYSRPSLRSLMELGLDPKLAYKSYPWIEKQIVQWPVLNPWQRAVKNALLQAGITPDNGYTFEHLYGTKISGTLFDKDGIRHSAAELLKSANPKNLDVLIHARAQKIVFDQSSGKPRAVGVIFKDEKGEQHEAVLSNKKKSEVILSSGAIGSPQLLLLSGIGPKAELEQMNISVVLNNQFVGKGMADNTQNNIIVPFNRPVEQSLIQTVGITREGVYIEAISGFGQSPSTIHYTHDNSSSLEEQNEEFPHEAYNAGGLLFKVSDPLSTGELSLNNTNADDFPNISFNYFSNPQDLQTCVNGYHILEKLVKTKYLTDFMQPGNDTFQKLLESTLNETINLIPKTADVTKSLEQYCRQTVITIWHYHGGCHKGKVINSDYEVFGAHGLRVIDGSTFVQAPGTNPQATVMMLGRYMGIKILRKRLGKAAGV